MWPLWWGLGLFGLALIGWYCVLGADRESIDPTNHIDELNREDGGPGPIP